MKSNRVEDSESAKELWVAPDMIDLEFGKTAGVKLNFRAVEYTRSGITYDPS